MRLSFLEGKPAALESRAAAEFGRDEIRVLTAAMPSPEEDPPDELLILSADERERAERFRAADARRRFVFGRSLLRRILGACLNVDPVRIEFGYSPRGKPRLERPASAGDLRFSLSHARAWTAVALARGREIGVDLEWIQRFTDGRLLAERIFSPRELHEFYSLPETQRQEAFFNGWTRKEAYLKATGEGLSDRLAAIEVRLAPGKKPALLGWPADFPASRRWEIRAVPSPRGYVGAVVFEETRQPVADPGALEAGT